MIVLGTLLPAFKPGFGSAQSLAESAVTVTVAIWSMAAASMWKVTLRHVHDADRIGLLCLLFLAAYGVFLWNEEVREPVATLFGNLQSSFKPTAWVVIGIGAVLILLSARSEARIHVASSDVSNGRSQMQSIGATLAVLGCLLGLAIVNPFSEMSPAAFKRGVLAWEDETNALRWVVLGTTAFAIVSCFQYPAKSPLILRRVIQVYALLIGICLILLPSLAGLLAWHHSVAVAIVWGITSLICFAMSPSQPLPRWQQLIVYSPFITFFLLLVVSGEIHDGALMLFTAFTVAAGFVMCRNTTYVDAATFIAAFVAGLPAGLMALTGVPNEFTRIGGMSHAACRVILLAVSVLLAWALFLSIRASAVTSTEPDTDTTTAVTTSSNREHA